MAYAKYTFFEAATQHGYIVALMSGRLAKSREFYQIIIDPTRGRVFQVFKSTNPEVPFFEFVIPERETTESTKMWEAKAKKALDGEWGRYLKAKGQFGVGTTVPPSSEPSNPPVSSTGAPPNPASLAGMSVEEEPVIAACVHDLLIPESSPTEPPSSPASAPRSRKSGSKSRS